MRERNKTIAENLNVGNDNSDRRMDLSVVSILEIRTSCRLKPPPFLGKLYAMVVDPETNDIVSFSPSKQSFIIWDRNRFQSLILPKYFKHNNFLNFNSQLNNYGFNKINWVQYEYANPLFVEGRKDLLIRIRRKNVENSQSEDMPDRSVMKATLQILRSDQMKLEQQIQELRAKQEDLLDEFSMIRDNIEATLEDQEDLKTGLIAHLVQQSVIQNLQDHQENYGTEEPVAQILHLASPDNNSSEDYPDQDPKLDQTNVEPVSTPSDDPEKSTPGQKIISDDSAFWKMMLEDDSVHSGGLVPSST
ncbi:hypothetical protein Leryth_017778 [Lithospermum erythrorhizon]|nr:hypothetical protein Leryth_017778 [Lithospermum erythrorhizon]